MSLQDTTNGGTLQTYSIACRQIWTNWLLTTPQQRLAAFRTAVLNATGFLPALPLIPANISANGSFSWADWRIRVRPNRLNKPGLRLYKFVELCGTFYHEARHAEQFYRIAQGVAAGTLQIPDKSLAQQVQEYTSSGALSFQN